MDEASRLPIPAAKAAPLHPLARLARPSRPGRRRLGGPLGLIAFLPLLLLFFFSSGCATTPSKPSAVAEQVEHVRQALTEMTASYEKKDEAAFFAAVDPSFQSSPALKEQVPKDWKAFSDISVEIKIDRVEIREGAITTAVHWGGIWKTAASAPPLEKKGHALLVWTTGEQPLLLEIRGEAPFGISPGGI